MKTNMSHLLLVGMLAVAIFASSNLVILQPSSMPNQSAFATFPGENGKIAFTKQGSIDLYGIYVMNADGSGETRLTTTDSVVYFYPDWSPDGTKIAFTRSSGSEADVYVMNADGSGETRLTDNTGFDGDPSWSPDGTQIAFISERVGGPDVYVMNTDGSNPTRLTTSHTNLYPDWSPDGTKIAFSSYRNNNYDIYVINADGSGLTRLTTDASADYYPSWSPDGTKIAFFVDRNDGNGEIYVMNADGSDLRNISNNPASDTSPSWSPDGTQIAFARHEGGGNMEIYVMNADGSQQARLTDNSAPDVDPDWGTATETEPADTTPPVITIPEDMTVEATGPDGAQVSFEQEPSATDDLDGPVDVTCNYNSGDTFPIGETVVTCSAEDAAGNGAEEMFTVTVQDTTAPDVEITQATDRRNRVLAEGDTTPTPYIRIAFEATDAVGVEDTECSLDGQAFTSCISPVAYDRLSRGTHQVTVRATDEAGNTGEDRFLFTIGSPSSSAAAAPGRQ
jgi:Tol biopolymer transport system component